MTGTYKFSEEPYFVATKILYNYTDQLHRDKKTRTREKVKTFHSINKYIQRQIIDENSSEYFCTLLVQVLYQATDSNINFLNSYNAMNFCYQLKNDLPQSKLSTSANSTKKIIVYKAQDANQYVKQKNNEDKLSHNG